MQTQVLIIGAGVTGTGLACDLALRGVASVVVERRDINAGASGANHGLLHSGARYVSADPTSARECREESRLLKGLAPACIEDTGGLFVALPGDDETYIADFPRLCEGCAIGVKMIPLREALELEPALAPEIIAAYQVEDASINPFMLSLENMAAAEARGSQLLRHAEILGFIREGGRIRRVHLLLRETGKELAIEPEQVVNAAGAWAAVVASRLGITVPMVYSKGTILLSQTRVTRRVINRMRPPSDGDIVAPGGTVSLLGTTSVRLEQPEPCCPTMEEVNYLVDEAATMLPELAEARYIRAFAGVRGLLSTPGVLQDRSLSRGYAVLGHEADGLRNFITVTGGKLTTYRLMAEKAADLVCSRLGVNTPCLTRMVPLGSTELAGWGEPARAARTWLQQHGPKDPLLCECEMVPASAVDEILAHLIGKGESPDINALSLRSRLGKGSCQGASCGIRAVAHLYERGILSSDHGLRLLKEFSERRWHGLRPVLWGVQLAQAELQEALYCGLLGLES